MRSKHYYIALTPEEKREIIQSLILKRNRLLVSGKYADAIDDVLYKIINTKSKRVKIKYI